MIPRTLVTPGAFAWRPLRAAVIRVTARGLVSVYVASVVVAAIVGWRRLSVSTEMPGLAAIELVLLALPWSLTLAHVPFAHAPLAASFAVVVLGVVLNSLMLVGLAKLAERFVNRLAQHRGGGADVRPPPTAGA